MQNKMLNEMSTQEPADAASEATARPEAELLSELGRRFHAERKKAKMTQATLAERADLHRTYIGLVERGETNLTIITMLRLSEALGVPLARILDGLHSSHSKTSKLSKLQTRKVRSAATAQERTPSDTTDRRAHHPADTAMSA